MAAFELFKRKVTYEDKDKNQKQATNFYIKCGENGELIAVDIHYFPNAKCEGRDPGFLGRKAVMENYASPLPEEKVN